MTALITVGTKDSLSAAETGEFQRHGPEGGQNWNAASRYVEEKLIEQGDEGQER